MNCPTGYGSLSDLCMRGYSQPPPDAIWCVEEKYLEDDYHNTWIWNDQGTGADQDCDINGGQSDFTKEFIGATTTRGGKKSLKKIAKKYFSSN